MIMARIVQPESGSLSGGITSSGGFQVLDRSTGTYRPLVRPGQFRASTPLVARVNPLPQQTRAQNLAAQRARLEAMRRASTANIEAKAAQRREAIRQSDIAKAQKLRDAEPEKRAGIREWEAYYARQGKIMPASQRESVERYERSRFYAAIAGRSYLTRDIIKAAGVGNIQGVARLFSVAYGGRTMPYWDAWFDRTMTAREIAARVAADYSVEILRRVKVKAQNRSELELWQDTGQRGPRPIPSQQLRPTLPPIPQPLQRRISQRAAPQLPKFEQLPAFRQHSRGRVWEELPPLLRGL